MLTSRQRELVLVGGGHSHVQVLKHLAMEPPPDTHVTLVVDRPVAVYSGMVPGYVAGQYRQVELEIDVVPLARRAGARVILSPAVGIDAEARRIELADRPPVSYDVAAVDIGSTVAGLDLPGVREYALPTRPIGLFVERVAEVEARALAGSGPFRVVVVGGGAGGVELAFTLQERLRRATDRSIEVDIVHNGERLMPGYPDSLLRRIEAHAQSRRIRIHLRRRVAAAEPGAVQLEDGERMPCDALLWVTGAFSHPVFEPSGLPVDSRGFVLTRPTLQVQGHDDLFAVGDCATMADFPETAKAGVYAVRQGPYLTRNLQAWLAGGELEDFQPQSGFLTLLNLGDGNALGAKWGISFEGERVMRLKDWIDRRFMQKFQVLDAHGGITEEFSENEMEADAMEMLCGGCAAKMGRSVLQQTLDRLGPAPASGNVVLGLEVPDDAAAWELPDGRMVVSSVDFFPSFTDDPYLVGKVAATNAISDLEATGARPVAVLAVVGVPVGLDPEAAGEVLYQVLAGARAVFDPREIVLAGGHTVTSQELQVGFSVEGLAESRDALLRIDRLAVGQSIVLTKPLGTGVIMRADMMGRAAGPWLQATLESMLRSNEQAARIAAAAGVTAATDVSGFGLAGHLAEMAQASGVSAVIDLDALPSLPGAEELLVQGLRSTFHEENARARKGMAFGREALGHPRLELIFDPQTAGGLLLGVDAPRADRLLTELVEGGDRDAAVIGRVADPRPDDAPLEVTARG